MFVFVVRTSKLTTDPMSGFIWQKIIKTFKIKIYEKFI